MPLSGTLYLPRGLQARNAPARAGLGLPARVLGRRTAGQVRGSPNTFTRVSGPSPLVFLTQGYAVLMDATMPVVGDPETMNDTYVEQIASARRGRRSTSSTRWASPTGAASWWAGHSYGAFMTANLLAHSDLFAAGIARSGAYNRTLTPFGFQSERRSFWEAPRPLPARCRRSCYANKINEPILLIHGEADNNSGTFPIQSERLFQAIRGNGGTARLCCCRTRRTATARASRCSTRSPR